MVQRILVFSPNTVFASDMRGSDGNFNINLTMYIEVFVYAHEKICGCLVVNQVGLGRHRDATKVEHATQHAA
jgi:hypothetical protein